MELCLNFGKRIQESFFVLSAQEWMVMRMMCKDCLHRDGCCNFVPIEGTIEERGEYLYECLKKPCKDFKNKADFVEVVRCKDCEHYEADIICEGVGYCNEHQKGMRENNFCSYGERWKDDKD